MGGVCLGHLTPRWAQKTQIPRNKGERQTLGPPGQSTSWPSLPHELGVLGTRDLQSAERSGVISRPQRYSCATHTQGSGRREGGRARTGWARALWLHRTALTRPCHSLAVSLPCDFEPYGLAFRAVAAPRRGHPPARSPGPCRPQGKEATPLPGLSGALVLSLRTIRKNWAGQTQRRGSARVCPAWALGSIPSTTTGQSREGASVK